MNLILRKDGGGRALAPFYHSWGLDEMEALAREFWDAWKPLTSEHRLVPHTDIYEEKDDE